MLIPEDKVLPDAQPWVYSDNESEKSTSLLTKKGQNDENLVHTSSLKVKNKTADSATNEEEASSKDSVNREESSTKISIIEEEKLNPGSKRPSVDDAHPLPKRVNSRRLKSSTPSNNDKHKSLSHETPNDQNLLVEDNTKDTVINVEENSSSATKNPTDDPSSIHKRFL